MLAGATPTQTPLPHVLQVVCSWCRRDMGTKPSRQPAISHGICLTCVTQWRQDAASHRKPTAPC